MRKLVVFVAIFTLAINAIVVVSLLQKRAENDNCASAKLPKLELSGVNPGLFFGLIKR